MRCRPLHLGIMVFMCLSVTWVLYISIDNTSNDSMLQFRIWIRHKSNIITLVPIQSIHDDPNLMVVSDSLIMIPRLQTVKSSQNFALKDFRDLRREFRVVAKKIRTLAFDESFFLHIEHSKGGDIRNSNLRKIIINSIYEQRRVWKTRSTLSLKDLISSKTSPNIPIWSKYHMLINERGLPSNLYSDYVLNILKNGEIRQVDEIEKGTQIKLRVTFTDETVAVLKPMRVSRSYQTPPNHFYFSDIERHNSEIASYNLDRILKFNRAPPTIGRIFNISKEIKPFALEDFLATFFISPVGNICFRGQCKYYCDTAHAVCGINKDILEASIQIMLPVAPHVNWVRMTHPYRRSYSAKHFAEWETNPNYCSESVFVDDNFHSRLMLDMIDTCIFDFLTGNLDRHHLVKMEELGINSTIFHIDQGRGFGRYNDDDISILMPLIQCCFVRYSTMNTLTQFSESGFNSLGETLRRAMKQDVLDPILIDEHYEAINRRLTLIFHHIKICINKVGNISQVIIDDGF